MSNFLSLEIGKRSAMTHQTALSVTGHNVANANTACISPGSQPGNHPPILYPYSDRRTPG